MTHHILSCLFIVLWTLLIQKGVTKNDYWDTMCHLLGLSQGDVVSVRVCSNDLLLAWQSWLRDDLGCYLLGLQCSLSSMESVYVFRSESTENPSFLFQKENSFSWYYSMDYLFLVIFLTVIHNTLS